MTFKEYMFLIRKSLLDKSNIIFLMIMAFLIFIIYGCVMVINLSFDIKRKIFQEDLEYRTIITNMPREEINKLANIEYYTSDKYNLVFPTYVSEFNTQNEKGYLYLKALLKPEEIEIKSGRNIKSSGEVICPSNFYPYFGENNIDKSLYLKGKNIIGRTFNIKSANEDKLNEIFNFKIVGVYKNKPFVESNTCYLSEEDLDLIGSKYSYVTSSKDSITGEENTIYHEYKNNLVIVNIHSNLLSVVSEIKDAGYIADIAVLDDTLLQYLFYIPLFISLIVLIISINIIYNFVNKKVNNRSKHLGIMKSLGYENKELVKIEVLENLILATIGMLIAIFLLLIAYFVISDLFLAPFVYINYYVPIPIIFLILSSFFIILVIIFLTKKKVNKTLKIRILNLLQREMV